MMKARSIRTNTQLKRGREVSIFIDGQPVKAYEGETLATALMAAGHMVFQMHEDRASGVFCNIGVCHSCLVTVDGRQGIKACCTAVAAGQHVETRNVLRRKSI
jgi:sarcosine oxidase subunit alpha